MPTFKELMLLLAAAFLALATIASASSASGNRLLVILNSAKEEAAYSKLLGSLKSRGFTVIVTAASEKNALVKFEERLFDHVLVLAHSSQAIGGVTAASIIDFLNRGGNALITASSSVSETIRDIAIEFSVELDEKGFAVHDDYASLDSDKTTIVTPRLVGPAAIVSEKVKSAATKKPIVFRGTGARLTGRNKLIVPVLTGTATSFSWPANSKKPIDSFAILGSQLALVSALQTRGNARIVFSGSADLFSDELIEKKLADGSSNGNLDFANELTKWVFQEKSVVKIVKTSHHRENEDKQHGAYRIKDDMVYRIELTEFADSKWRPFDALDMQFEAVMLDPYIRGNLTQLASGSASVPTASAFEIHFKLPDVYGVFTFKVDYRRHGYSWVTSKETVAIHPFRHNEYPRFLTPAFPYYVNSFSMIASFFVLTVVVLYYAPELKAMNEEPKKTK
ncbi:hypothetical protein HDU97_009292 [Phlyctochytrium planicorne]|nr:hypothetical protein HDU97_009292 [Phlyctochytrium planicorne]